MYKKIAEIVVKSSVFARFIFLCNLKGSAAQLAIILILYFVAKYLIS